MNINSKHFKQHYFDFNGLRYKQGTVIKIYQNKRDKFDYYTNIIFKGYSCNNDNLYHFGSLYDKWVDYCMTQEELQLYIEKIEQASYINDLEDDTTNIHPSHIEGIVNAWIWYIIIMIFAVFIKGIASTIIIWIISSCVFWSWRKNKMNGG